MLGTQQQNSLFNIAEQPEGGEKLWRAEPIVQLIKERIACQQMQLRKTPHLAILCTNYREDSRIYVSRKIKALQHFGFHHTLSEATSLAEQLKVIQEWNQNVNIDGILIQFPVSDCQGDFITLRDALTREKDVDGMKLDSPFVPCTAQAVLEVLNYHKVSLRGTEVVIIGKSAQVGLPIANLLLKAGATVTVVHKATTNLQAHLRRAQIIISAAGSPCLVSEDLISAGCIVIDVGITRTQDGHIRGDVNLSRELLNKVQAVTPVPGGIGPITVYKLVENLIHATTLNNKIKM